MKNFIQSTFLSEDMVKNGEYYLFSFCSFLFCLLKHLDILLNLDHALFVELLPVAEEEEHLQEDKEGRRDERLIPRIEESRGATLKDSMADKLQDPRRREHDPGQL